MNELVGCPVAIGGIGGSGTRMVASLMHNLGYYLGDDLNDAFDNLWFTLIFKRRSILLERPEIIRRFIAIFLARMQGKVAPTDTEREMVRCLTGQDRLQHPSEWLTIRANSFFDSISSKFPEQPWGWKEPNVHIIINRFFEVTNDLKYIHVYRHPLDMSVSANQNQLINWGPIFLDRNITVEPRDSLAYWCVAHKRILDLYKMWPSRIMMLQFELLCADPELYCSEICHFLGAKLPESALLNFRKLIKRPQSVGRYKRIELEQYMPHDLHYVRKLGFLLT